MKVKGKREKKKRAVEEACEIVMDCRATLI
jgi:hypothetical protein